MTEPLVSLLRSAPNRLLRKGAWIGALLSLALASGALSSSAQEPAAGSPSARRPSPSAPASAQRMINPHGNRQNVPRIVPAPDLAPGEIEVRLSSNEPDLIDNEEVKLSISKQSIAQGNSNSELVEKTNIGGIVRFQNQSTETDHLYTVSTNVAGAQYSTQQFQFRAGGGGLRVLLPVYKASSDVNGILILSRALVAIIPQDNLFSIDFLWRIENYSDTAWVPDKSDQQARLVLPEGAKAITIKEDTGDARFEKDGDGAIRLAGTFAPGQHDLMMRFHLDSTGESSRDLVFPSGVHLGSMRVLLDSAPGMALRVEGFSDPVETRNGDGQRRLISSRDFLGEKQRAPDKIQVHITGIPTPAAGKNIAVSIAGVIAVGGLVASIGRFRARTPVRSQLSKEDRERAGELLLEELIRLEQAFKHGEIGRKTHDAAKRQLLEAYARLGAGSPASA
ncbi:MAG TPA: hypothetical protein VFS67_09605 [Polyangiaceae bacterium]|jgi:hypothetical protein|nr:hypothetical protein [Polyangiaceae bacterium]